QLAPDSGDGPGRHVVNGRDELETAAQELGHEVPTRDARAEADGGGHRHRRVGVRAEVTGSKGVHCDAAVQLGQVDVLTSAQDVAQDRHTGLDALADGDAGSDVPVLEAPAAPAVD